LQEKDDTPPTYCKTARTRSAAREETQHRAIRTAGVVSTLRKLASDQWIHYALFMRSDEQPGTDQFNVMRKISGERRLQLTEELFWSARRMKAAGLRIQHPEWTEEQIISEVRRIFLHARS